MFLPLAIPLFIFIVFLLIIFLLWKFRIYIREPKEKEELSSRFEFISNLKVKDFKFDPKEDHLEDLGYQLIKADIKSIYLVHGTFVGEDPFHLVELIQNSFPKVGEELMAMFKNRLKKSQDSFAKDLGNFIQEHKDIITTMTKGKINIVNFTWSSGNNHYARMRGAIDLISHLAQNHDKKDRVLLIGHSHAGQIFALLSQLLHHKAHRKELFEILNSVEQFHLKTIQNQVNFLKHLSLDFVTLGAPPKYEWCLGDNMRLLHLINHRGNTAQAGSFKGASFTKDGDYIQQWGLSGSDIKSPIKAEQLINERLDDVLGVGTNLDFLRTQIKLRNRFHNAGYHLLIDYGDQSKLPNFFQTILGHGVYTKISHLKFLFHEICGKFYL